MFDIIDQLADILKPQVLSFLLVFARVGAIAAFLPGFGEAFLSMRLRLATAICLTLIVFPAAPVPDVPLTTSTLALSGLFLRETAIGLLLGLGMRLVVMALQFAGSIAAQSTSIAQIAGTGIAPDPLPAIGNILLMGGLTLAMILGLHVKAVAAILYSYTLFTWGSVIEGGSLFVWGVDHAMRAFILAFTLASPFLLTAILYNISLGVINRAMPQLMVAFVGAPAITGLTIVILILAIGIILTTWMGALDRYLLNPLDIR